MLYKFYLHIIITTSCCSLQIDALVFGVGFLFFQYVVKLLCSTKKASQLKIIALEKHRKTSNAK